MTVKELINQLEIYDEDTEVRIEDSQWAQPIKKIESEVYYTDSDGNWYCVDPDDGEGLTKPKTIILLRHQ